MLLLLQLLPAGQVLALLLLVVKLWVGDCVCKHAVPADALQGLRALSGHPKECAQTCVCVLCVYSRLQS